MELIEFPLYSYLWEICLENGIESLEEDMVILTPYWDDLWEQVYDRYHNWEEE